jgi:hypothetical protein
MKRSILVSKNLALISPIVQLSAVAAFSSHLVQEIFFARKASGAFKYFATFMQTTDLFVHRRRRLVPLGDSPRAERAF